MEWPHIEYHRTEIVILDHDVRVSIQAVTPDGLDAIADTVRLSF